MLSNNTSLQNADLSPELVQALNKIGHIFVKDLQRLGVRLAWLKVPNDCLPELINFMNSQNLRFIDFSGDPKLLLNDDLVRFQQLNPRARPKLREKRLTSMALLKLLTRRDLETLLRSNSPALKGAIDIRNSLQDG